MIGNGYADSVMDEKEARELIEKALTGEDYTGKRILMILPDLTRSAPIPLLYRTIYDVLADKVSCLDGLIALGTHQPLSEEKIFKRVGITKDEYTHKYSHKSQFFNHEWQNAGQLLQIGTIPSDEIKAITGGIIQEGVEININKRIFDYDRLFVLGPVFPHEVVGFSGGNKYFFPGISGEDIINMFHWLGAMITNAEINGTKNTPVRAVLNRAAEFITVPRLYFNIVVNFNNLHGLFIGDGIHAWGAAADLSAQVNVKYVNKRFKKVLGVAPQKYEDIWTAGKVAYKSETIIEDGGDLIIYAPHITEVSVTHGEHIEAIGYHVRDFFATRLENYAHVPGGILAHSTHVKGAGTFEDGIEKPRFNVILATGISKERCEHINLGYMDPAAINLDEWKDRESEGILFVPEAGEVLYKVRKEEKPMINWKKVLEKNPALTNISDCELEGSGIYPASINHLQDTIVFMIKEPDGKSLIAAGKGQIFDELHGQIEAIGSLQVKVCPLNHENAVLLRKYFPFTAPKCLRDSAITIGLGDRLGIATAGHVRLLKDYAVSPVLCQQSIRELNLTGRTYPGVLDDVSWCVYQEGYKDGFGADGDHLKTFEDIKLALASGFTMITLDCSEYIDNSITGLCSAKVDELYQTMNAEMREGYERKYLAPHMANGLDIHITPDELKRIVLIYSKAIDFTEKVYHEFITKNQDIVYELSIDETFTPTSLEAHFVIASEFRDRGVRIDNLAPRFCGEFQKGIDYIGNLDQFRKEFSQHCRLAEHFGYKISVHSGSDKFSVFPAVGEEANGRYHLKTAGTNWLEAVRVIAGKNPQLYRRMHQFALEHVEEARKYYHISAVASKIPDIHQMRDEELPSLMEQIDARQFLHITYGLILNAGGGLEFRKELYETLSRYEDDFYSALAQHIGRHLDTLNVPKK